jgi:hypothetical protein
MKEMKQVQKVLMSVKHSSIRRFYCLYTGKTIDAVPGSMYDCVAGILQRGCSVKKLIAEAAAL